MNNISQQGMTIVSIVVSSIREWYEDDTILVDKDGLSGTITNVGTGPFNENTILVDKGGLSGTTTEIPA